MRSSTRTCRCAACAVLCTVLFWVCGAGRGGAVWLLRCIRTGVVHPGGCPPTPLHLTHCLAPPLRIPPHPPTHAPAPRPPQDVNFRHFVAKLKVHSEMYQDEQKLRTTVVSLQAPAFAAESRVLLDLIA